RLAEPANWKLVDALAQQLVRQKVLAPTRFGPRSVHEQTGASANMSGASGDEVLVRLAVGGDRAAFGALVTPHVTDLTRLCRRVAGPALADDCVQDTLLLALLRLQSLRDPGLFENWLRGIAIRVCRRTLGRLAPHAPLPSEDEQLGTW